MKEMNVGGYGLTTTTPTSPSNLLLLIHKNTAWDSFGRLFAMIST